MSATACSCGAGAHVIAPMHHETCPNHGPATFAQLGAAPEAGGWTRAYGPVTITAEAMAEAQRQIGALQRLQEKNEAALRRWLFNPGVLVGPFRCDPEALSHMANATEYAYRGIDRSATPEKLSGAVLQNRGGHLYAGGIKITADPALRPNEVRMLQEPVDPLDVEYDGVKLRLLVARDRCNSQEAGPPLFRFTPAQRAAVSAHWSAQLRAKIAAGAAADKERATSVVIDLEDP